MYIFLPLLALMSTLVSALPTALSGDGRGCTIYTEQNLGGSNTAVPGSAYCTDLNNIFGNFDGQVRSMNVEAGYSCKFYDNYGCRGNMFQAGFKDRMDARRYLSDTFDRKIHSIYCSTI